MSKKAKIVTYCTWTSIGSVLQSLGLKNALKDIDCKSVIMLRQGENDFVKTKIDSVKSLIQHLFQIVIHGKRKKAFEKRMNFISTHLDIEYYDSRDSFISLAKRGKTDFFVAGSDQIWNPRNLNPYFFLDPIEDRKCISYAASMGYTSISTEKRTELAELLSRFSDISVREQECVSSLSPLTKNEISVHLDPVFLVSRDKWQSYEEEYKISKPYILLYMIYWDKSCKKKIKELKKKTGLPVYAISNGLSRTYADKHLFDVGVSDFLWLIDHAEYVISSSFHGVALSIIFNKKFAPVVNPDAPSRIDNLLRTLNIPRVDIDDLPNNSIDCSAVNHKIAEEKKRSVDYLKRTVCQ